MSVFTRWSVKFKNIEIVPGGTKIGIGGIWDLPVTNFFVDVANGKSGNRGLGWGANNALDTIANGLAAVTALGAERGRARVYVAPSGSYSEAVSTPTNAVAPHNALIAINPLDISSGSVYWASGANDASQLTVLARGWRISGFEFQCPTTVAAVQLDDTAGNAWYTQIDSCHFTGGKYGINAIGAPSFVKILRNQFFQIQTAGGIALGATAGANCSMWRIEDNYFTVNINHIVFVSASAPYSAIIRGNTFVDTWVGGGPVTWAINLTTQGASNIITQNFLGGTFTVAGGYQGGSTDEWYANACSAGWDSVADPG